MSNDADSIELIYLLLHGQLPGQVLEGKAYTKLAPIVKSINFLKGKGESPPFINERVATIAHKKYNAGSAVLALMKEVTQYRPDKPVLETVQHRMLLQHIIELASKQATDGEYNPHQLLSVLNSSPSSQGIVKAVSNPKGPLVEIIAKTGIPKVDMIIGGIGAELCIVSARVKQGKSHFMMNICARQPKSTRVLYITVADYGYHEICWLLNSIKPNITEDKGDTLFIADLTSRSATLLDVESAIQEVEPTLCIVDRAEKLMPLVKYKEKEERKIAGDIFLQLRQFAKRYNCAMIVDGQYSSAGAEYAREKQTMSSEYMSEDRTQRQAVMDLWIGLMRVDGGVQLFLEGRRPMKLPDTIFVATDNAGRIR